MPNQKVPVDPDSDVVIGDIYEESPAAFDRDVWYRGFEWRVLKGVFAPYPVFGTVVGITAKNRAMYGGKRVLDLGCGCGVRGIIAKLSGADEVVASDICEIACHNTVLNSCRHACDITVVCTDMFTGLCRTFDTIVSYLPSRDAPVRKSEDRAIHDPGLRLNHQLIDESADYLVPGGELHTSLLDQGSIPDFLDQIEQRGYTVRSHKVRPHDTGDWHFLSLRWPG